MEATRDQNHVTTILGTDSLDGFTPMRIWADPTSHRLKIDDNTTGSDLSDDVDPRDQNFVTDLLGTSRTDGVTPTVVYGITASGKLMIDST